MSQRKKKIVQANWKTKATKAMIKFLFIILTLNDFTFAGINYRFKKGYVTGHISPAFYVNIFVGKFEVNCTYPYIKNKPHLPLCRE